MEHLVCGGALATARQGLLEWNTTAGLCMGGTTGGNSAKNEEYVHILVLWWKLYSCKARSCCAEQQTWSM
jgi:hypothetical protein